MKNIRVLFGHYIHYKTKEEPLSLIEQMQGMSFVDACTAYWALYNLLKPMVQKKKFPTSEDAYVETAEETLKLARIKLKNITKISDNDITELEQANYRTFSVIINNIWQRNKTGYTFS